MEGKRPGGLTALAVINFVFGGFNVLGTLGTLFMSAVVDHMAESGEASNQAERDMVAAWQQTGRGVMLALAAMGALSAFLLIASGVGYLRQSKLWGRVMGNAYAILSIAVAVASMLLVAKGAERGFQLLSMVGFIYPVLTLILLNTTFKEDFIR